eukprot:10281292-Alexandrium_andersonii.AAC.1
MIGCPEGAVLGLHRRALKSFCAAPGFAYRRTLESADQRPLAVISSIGPHPDSASSDAPAWRN